jgi:hypothetical protein
MEVLDPKLAALSAAFALAWAALGAIRFGGSRSGLVVRGLLGGGAAFGMAQAAYQLLGAGGLDLSWGRVLGGGWAALGVAALIGLIEEGAKLGGLLLAIRAAPRPGAVMGTAIAVCSGFAALESVLALSSAPAGLAVARAALAPVAHGVLAVPLAFGVAVSARRARRTGLVQVALGLALSAALHGAGDLALAAPRFGRLGFAVAMAAPVIALFVHLRRLAPARRAGR